MRMIAAKQGRRNLGTMRVKWWQRLTGKRDQAALPLYQAVVARARQPHWYLEGQVPDTVDGRFDMIAAVLATVLLRLEGDDTAKIVSVELTERFVDDMDAQLREIGIGDIVVGKHVGRMMSMLGGRLSAFREGFAGDLDGALVRNLYRGAAPGATALDHVRGAMLALRDGLAVLPTTAIVAGQLP